MKEAKASLVNIIRILFSAKIFSIIILVALYFSISCYGLFLLGLWDISQLKNSIITFLSVGICSLAKVDYKNKTRTLVFSRLIDSFKVLALVSFVVEAVPFAFFVELLLVPTITAVVMVHEVAKTKNEFEATKKFIDVVLSFIISFVLIRAFFLFVYDFSEYVNKGVLNDLFVPGILILLYVPVYFCLCMLFFL